MFNDKMTTTVEAHGNTYTFMTESDLTVTSYIEDVLEPLMIAMGYSPINVYEALGNTDMLDVLKGHDYE